MTTAARRVVNAAQAIPVGHVTENRISVRVRQQRDRVLVEISDTGAGIPPEIVPRIFDPFFTTKPVGVGTGLGLSICHSIVASMGGEITVESTVNRGTMFRVSLPIARLVSIRTQPSMPVQTVGRRLRILLVDDEPSVVRALHVAISLFCQTAEYIELRSVKVTASGCTALLYRVSKLPRSPARVTRDPRFAMRYLKAARKGDQQRFAQGRHSGIRSA